MPAFRTVLVLGLLLLLGGPAAGQAYLATYRSPELADQPAAICALQDGATVAAGLALTDLGAFASLICVDRLGQVEWYQRYEAPFFSVFQDVVETSDGDLIVVGTHDTAPLVARIDRGSGAVVWTRTFTTVSGEPASGELHAVVERGGGRVLAVGGIRDAAFNQDVLILELDLDGNLLAANVHGESQVSECALDVATLADGGFAVAGARTSTGRHLFLQRFDALDQQAQLWALLVESPGGIGREVAIAEAVGGGAFVCAGNNTGGEIGGNYYVVTLDPGWGIASAVVHEGGANDICRDLHATADGGYLVFGDTGGVVGRDPWLVKVSGSGAAEWGKRLEYSPGLEFGFGVDVTPGGGIVTAATVEHQTRLSVTSLWLQRLEQDGIAREPCAKLLPHAPQTTPVLTSPLSLDWNEAPADLAPAAGALHRVSTTPVAEIDCESCLVSVRGYGQGTAGSGGRVPRLTGVRGRCDGNPPRVLELSHSLGGAPALFLAGLTPAAFPFAGGELLVEPSTWLAYPLMLQGTPGVPGEGELCLSGPADVAPFLGQEIYTQFAVFDPGALKGIALSNGVVHTIGN